LGFGVWRLGVRVWLLENREEVDDSLALLAAQLETGLWFRVWGLGPREEVDDSLALLVAQLEEGHRYAERSRRNLVLVLFTHRLILPARLPMVYGLWFRAKDTSGHPWFRV
jgi:hypothetical protein